jgi:hypothetical protein
VRLRDLQSGLVSPKDDVIDRVAREIVVKTGITCDTASGGSSRALERDIADNVNEFACATLKAVDEICSFLSRSRATTFEISLKRTPPCSNDDVRPLKISVRYRIAKEEKPSEDCCSCKTRKLET